MKRVILFFTLIPFAVFAETAEEIIKKVDKNQLYTTQKFTAEMTIEKGSRKLVKKFFGFSRKDGEKAFMEFTNREDVGVKFLKLGEELWIYFPDADDTMKISGHMLRQGLMGSDISYEDLLETEEMEKTYTSKLLEPGRVANRECYVIELDAKVPDASYEKQVMFIDKEKYIPLKIELYARGGRLIKTMMLSDITMSGSRYVPNKIEIRDMRRHDSKTTLVFREIFFDVSIPGEVFQKHYLKK